LNSVEQSTRGFSDDYLAALLARASELVSRSFAVELRKRRMPMSVWRILSTLAGGDGLSIGKLAELTLMKQPTLTKMIDRMSLQGLVERRPSARDRRQTLVLITARGREHLSDLVVRAMEQERQVLAGLGEADVAQIKSMLRALIAGCP
jgi:DNA-binding MarR family transcriptional regulator